MEGGGWRVEVACRAAPAELSQPRRFHISARLRLTRPTDPNPRSSSATAPSHPITSHHIAHPPLFITSSYPASPSFADCCSLVTLAADSSIGHAAVPAPHPRAHSPPALHSLAISASTASILWDAIDLNCRHSHLYRLVTLLWPSLSPGLLPPPPPLPPVPPCLSRSPPPPPSMASAAVNRTCADLHCDRYGQGWTCILQPGSLEPVCLKPPSSSEWSQWWLIPLLIGAVVLLSTAYSAARRAYLARSGHVDSSHFSQLHTRELHDDDFDSQLGDPLEMDTLHAGEAEDSEEEQQHTHHPPIAANTATATTAK